MKSQPRVVIVGGGISGLATAHYLGAGPVHVHIQRWPQGLPQYVAGHQDRPDGVDAALRHLPGLHLTGAAYRGVGLASCVADAERTAQGIAQWLADVRAMTQVTS